jgi:hypothetical protein
LWLGETPFFQPLGTDPEAASILDEDLQPITLGVAEQEQVSVSEAHTTNDRGRDGTAPRTRAQGSSNAKLLLVPVNVGIVRVASKEQKMCAGETN